ncbi:hypothetical protein [Yoonia sp. 2307UL14-13]|uniref:hypothetical protein n=1 Tax=Yoonia sp. 2307UL14-13 TaxID=3126506 RepID=UPI00309CD9E3
MSTLYQRNTSVWALNRLREDALPRLIDDLKGQHEEGIPENICDEVKAAHREILDLASTIPDQALFRRSILPLLERYCDLYIQWNDIDGNDDSARKRRAELVKKIRKARLALATQVRKNMHVLENELDISLIDSMYKALNGIVQAAPKLFEKLSGAVTRYMNRREDQSEDK